MRYLTHILTLIFLALALEVSAQEYRNIRDFEYIRSATPWISSDNAAGLDALPVGRIANIEAFFHKHDGELRDINESANSFEAGASTEAFISLSELFAIHGRLEYRNFNGKGMGGPVLLDPEYNPLNFYESTDETPGAKNRELYNLAGGFSYRFFNKNWIVGAEIDYTAADAAKKKDPRFETKWMDLNLNAGVRFIASDAVSLGASLLYRRTLEDFFGSLFGNTDKIYNIDIDYGGFFGKTERLDGEGGMISMSGPRPMFNSFYGGSLQVEAGNSTKVFNQFTYLRRMGYYGRKSSSSVTYTENAGNIMEYRGVLTSRHDAMLHRIGLDFSFEGMKNMQNNYKMESEPGGESVVLYHGQKEVLAMNTIKAALSYDGYAGIADYRPIWEFGAGVSGQMRRSVTTIYPFERHSNVTHLEARLYGTRHLFFKHLNMLSFQLEGLMATGFGNPAEDIIIVSSSSMPPKSMDLFMNRHFEYKTAMRAGGCLRIRYTRFIGPKMGLYVEAKDCYTHMLKAPAYLKGRIRNILETKIGITF